MKQYYRLIVSPNRIPRSQKRERSKFVDLLNSLKRVEVVDEYRVIPELMNAKLEGDDLDHESIAEIVSDRSHHHIHCVYTQDQWDELEIRSTLRGQQNIHQDQIITYNRIFESSSYVRKYSGQLRRFAAYLISEMHELCHGAAEMSGQDIINAFVHFYFYGYEYMPKKDKEEMMKRWAKDPKPLDCWDEINWEALPELIPNKEGLRMVKLGIVENNSWAENKPVSIVWHHTGGNTLHSALQALVTRKLSYHAIIDTDGTVYCLVPLDRGAWHAGIMHNSTSRAENFYIESPNKMSIGVALVGTGEYTKEQLESATRYTKHLEKTLGESFDGLNMFTHNDIDSRKPEVVTDILSHVFLANEGRESVLMKLVKQILKALLK